MRKLYRTCRMCGLASYMSQWGTEPYLRCPVCGTGINWKVRRSLWGWVAFWLRASWWRQS